MQRFISPVGFTPRIVTRSIIASGINAGDRLEILRPEQSDQTNEQRTSNAINDIEVTLSGVVSDVTVDVITVRDTDFQAFTDECSELIMNGEDPVVCLGAGATDLQFPLMVAAIAHSEYLAGVMVYSELTDTAQSVTIPMVTRTIPGRTQDTFAVLADRNQQISLADLAEHLDVDRSTVTRHILALEEQGIVGTSTKGKEKMASLTILGRILARNFVE